MKEIAPGVTIETEYEGVTVGAISTSAGVIMIDSPLSVKDAQTWRSSCSRSSGASDRLLVLLDEHYDRCIGARALRCPIIAHEKTALAITGRNSASKPQNIRTGSIWETSSEVSSIHWAHPEITFTNEMAINWGEEPVLLEHHPGPSRGSTWVILPEKQVVFLGDSVIAGQPPFLANADMESWLENLELLKSPTYKDYILISGRDALVTKDDIRDQEKFLKKVQRLSEKFSNSRTDQIRIEEAGLSLIEDFKPRNKMETELFRTRLSFGFSQFCVNHLSKKTT
jgi:glyoxylase-like metal-dependent hydrolase (beta-lactamase superfamily II)